MVDTTTETPPPGGNGAPPPPPPGGNGAPPPPPPGDQPAYATLEDNEVKGLMETKGYKQYGDVAKAYWNLNKLVKGSNDVVAIPGADAKPEDWEPIFEKLGRPKSADGYDFGLPEGTQIDEDFAKSAKAWLHSAGVSAAGAKGFANAYQKYVVERTAKEAAEAQRTDQAAVAEIKKTYGQGFDAALAKGTHAVKALGLEQGVLDSLEGAMGAPAVIALLTSLGSKLGNEDIRLEGINKEGFGASKAELESKKAVMRGNPEIVAALTDPRNPNHLRYKKEWDNTIDALSKMK